jgi:asparagine N-glycosylation enzyme membrane subunit Stt3
MSWRLWFLQLSGWPVFLIVVAATLAFMVLLSWAMPRIAHRSMLQNALLAAIVLAAIAFVMLLAAGILMRG